MKQYVTPSIREMKRVPQELYCASVPTNGTTEDYSIVNIEWD